MSSTVLSERLKEMEGEGPVVEKPYGKRPPGGVRCRLSDGSKQLEAIVSEIAGWQSRWKK